MEGRATGGTHRTHDVISALDDDARNVAAVIWGQENGQHLTGSVSEYHGVHLVNLPFLQKLSVPHEPLILSESALAPLTGLLDTHTVDEIVVLYPGEGTWDGTPQPSVSWGLGRFHNRRTSPNHLFLLSPGKPGQRTTSKWPSCRTKGSEICFPVPYGQVRTPIATTPWQHPSLHYRPRN